MSPNKPLGPRNPIFWVIPLPHHQIGINIFGFLWSMNLSKLLDTERMMFIPKLEKVGKISRVEAHITKLTRQLQNLVLKFV